MLPFPLKSERQNIRLIINLINNAERIRDKAVINENVEEVDEMQGQVKELKKVLFEILLSDEYKIAFKEEISIGVRTN